VPDRVAFREPVDGMVFSREMDGNDALGPEVRCCGVDSGRCGATKKDQENSW